jgi:type II secretory ATPase GspE/PulE/Tfp pilus assembly ATPase PilB-like protein
VALFGGDDDFDEDEEEEIELVLFQGALNGKKANMKANARLVQAGLMPAKEIVTDGIARRAETIRIEPKGGGSLIRMMVDGVAYPSGKLPKKRALAVTQLLKLLSGLDEKERSKPQSGGINSEYEEEPYQLKIDSVPVKGGAERMTIRIQNTDDLLERPEEMGFTEDLRIKIRELASRGKGVLLACGAPQTGVSTCALGVLRSVDAYLYDIQSIADLGGRELMHVRNLEKLPEDDLDANLMRIIRSEGHVVFTDPLDTAEVAKTIFTRQEDIVIVSEMAARDSAAGIAQLVEWLGDAEAAANGLQAMFSTKLIRKLCKSCKEAFRPNPKLLVKIGLPKKTKALYRPPQPSEEEDEEERPPCRNCGDIGYYGRTALYEMLEMTDEMRKLIIAGASPQELRALASEEKMPTFQSEGLRLVAEGVTSLEELQRSLKKKSK